MEDLKFVSKHIKILGTGCAKCESLEKLTKRAVEELEIEVNIEKVADFEKIMSYGVMSTPALVINEKVIFSGKLPSYDQVKNLIKES